MALCLVLNFDVQVVRENVGDLNLVEVRDGRLDGGQPHVVLLPLLLLGTE